MALECCNVAIGDIRRFSRLLGQHLASSLIGLRARRNSYAVVSCQSAVFSRRVRTAATPSDSAIPATHAEPRTPVADTHPRFRPRPAALFFVAFLTNFNAKELFRWT